MAKINCHSKEVNIQKFYVVQKLKEILCYAKITITLWHSQEIFVIAQNACHVTITILRKVNFFNNLAPNKKCNKFLLRLLTTRFR